MVRVNGKKFKIYALDSVYSFKQRVAKSLNTLDSFLYIPNNKPISLSIEDSLSKSIGTVKIGQGRFGEVYLGCIDKECKKKVAIKVVLNEDITHEYKISKRLSSYGVVKSFTIQKCKNVMFMYSEYANNGTLKSFLRNNKTNLLRHLN